VQGGAVRPYQRITVGGAACATVVSLLLLEGDTAGASVSCLCCRRCGQPGDDQRAWASKRAGVQWIGPWAPRGGAGGAVTTAW
jgi:hypothetical protein